MAAPIQSLFDRRVVGGKEVFIVDDHNKALAPWAITRRNVETAPTLVTIDYHMDADQAFRREAFLRTEGGIDEDGIEAIRMELLASSIGRWTNP